MNELNIEIVTKDFIFADSQKDFNRQVNRIKSTLQPKT
jgi:hypothetical protein